MVYISEWYQEAAVDPSSLTVETIRTTGGRLLVDINGPVMSRSQKRSEFDDVHKIVKIITWIGKVVFKSMGSRDLKHLCQYSIHEYVTNGEFIMAAILTGRRIKFKPAKAERNGRHAFNSVMVSGNSSSSIRAATRLLQLFDTCGEQEPATLERNVNQTHKILAAASDVPVHMSAVFDAFMAQRSDWRSVFSFDRRIFRFWSIYDKAAVRMLLEVLYSKGLPHLRDIILAHMTCKTDGFGHYKLPSWEETHWPYLRPKISPCVPKFM